MVINVTHCFPDCGLYDSWVNDNRIELIVVFIRVLVDRVARVNICPKSVRFG